MAKETKETKETKEITIKQDAGALAALQGAFTPQENPGLTAQDILIAKVLLMQFMSDAVTEGNASAGDFVDSVTGELLGSFKKPLAFIPFHLTKTFIEYEDIGTEKKYLRIIPIDSNPMSKGFNDSLPYEETVDGKHIVRDRAMNVYVLDPLNPELPPRIITFRRTSLKAGKQLATGMYVRNASKKLPPYAFIWELCARLESNDKGKYYVFESKSTETIINSELIETIKYWIKQVSSKSIKEDTSDIVETKVGSGTTVTDEVGSGAF